MYIGGERMVKVKGQRSCRVPFFMEKAFENFFFFSVVFVSIYYSFNPIEKGFFLEIK